MIPTLLTYISDPQAAARLAADTGADPQWLWQIATGWRGKRPSKILAAAVERATGGKVTRAELRPDLWGDQPEAA